MFIEIGMRLNLVEDMFCGCCVKECYGCLEDVLKYLEVKFLGSFCIE